MQLIMTSHKVTPTHLLYRQSCVKNMVTGHEISLGELEVKLGIEVGLQSTSFRRNGEE